MASVLRSRLASVPLHLRRQINAATRHHSTTSTPSPTTSSVSSDEVSHFSTLASSWWDPHGSSRLLHLMNPLRHQFISRCHTTSSPLTSGASPTEADHTTPGLRYLDVGCGGGIFAESAARLSTTASVTAIDPTPEVIRVATSHLRTDPALLQSGKLRYLNCSIEDLNSRIPGKDGGEGLADVVSVFEVVEHVNSPFSFLSRCMDHVKPGGWIVGSTIARTWSSWVTTKLVAEDVLRIVPRGTHDWGKYIQPAELREWAGQQRGWGGWTVMGVVYVPGFGWKEVKGGEDWGNYFFGLRREH